MSQGIINSIAKISEAFAKGVLWLIVSGSALIYKILFVTLGFMFPILKKALVWIIVILIIGVIVLKVFL